MVGELSASKSHSKRSWRNHRRLQMTLNSKKSMGNRVQEMVIFNFVHDQGDRIYSFLQPSKLHNHLIYAFSTQSGDNARDNFEHNIQEQCIEKNIHQVLMFEPASYGNNIGPGLSALFRQPPYLQILNYLCTS